MRLRPTDSVRFQCERGTDEVDVAGLRDLAVTVFSHEIECAVRLTVEPDQDIDFPRKAQDQIDQACTVEATEAVSARGHHEEPAVLVAP